MAAMNAMQAAMVLMLVLVASCFGGVRGGNVLLQGYQIGVGAALTQSPYQLIMQSDCNLVLYKNGDQVLWASNTNGAGSNCYFIMQTDGNAVIYNSGNAAVFSTGTYGRNDGAHYIILQSDGNLVMYNGGGAAIWATGTNGLKDAPELDGRTLLLHAEPAGVLAALTTADHN